MIRVDKAKVVSLFQGTSFRIGQWLNSEPRLSHSLWNPAFVHCGPLRRFRHLVNKIWGSSSEEMATLALLNKVSYLSFDAVFLIRVELGSDTFWPFPSLIGIAPTHSSNSLGIGSRYNLDKVPLARPKHPSLITHRL